MRILKYDRYNIVNRLLVKTSLQWSGSQVVKQTTTLKTSREMPSPTLRLLMKNQEVHILLLEMFDVSVIISGKYILVLVIQLKCLQNESETERARAIVCE